MFLSYWLCRNWSWQNVLWICFGWLWFVQVMELCDDPPIGAMISQKFGNFKVVHRVFVFPFWHWKASFLNFFSLSMWFNIPPCAHLFARLLYFFSSEMFEMPSNFPIFVFTICMSGFFHGFCRICVHIVVARFGGTFCPHNIISFDSILTVWRKVFATAHGNVSMPCTW